MLSETDVRQFNNVPQNQMGCINPDSLLMGMHTCTGLYPDTLQIHYNYYIAGIIYIACMLSLVIPPSTYRPVCLFFCQCGCLCVSLSVNRLLYVYPCVLTIEICGFRGRRLQCIRYGGYRAFTKIVHA